MNKRKLLYGSVSKPIVLYMMVLYHWAWVDHGYYNWFYLFVTIRVMLVLPKLRKRLLNTKKEKVHL